MVNGYKCKCAHSHHFDMHAFLARGQRATMNAQKMFKSTIYTALISRTYKTNAV